MLRQSRTWLQALAAGSHDVVRPCVLQRDQGVGAAQITGDCDIILQVRTSGHRPDD